MTRAQTDAPQFVMRAGFGNAALTGEHKDQAYIVILREGCQIASEGCRFGSRGSPVASIAESANSSSNSRAFEAIKNCSAQVYSTRSTVNRESVHWEKAEGGSQNRAVSTLIYVSDAS